MDINNFLTDLGAKLRIARTIKNETLQTVANAVGTTHAALSRIENGRYESLQIALLIKLCNYYQVDLAPLLSMDTNSMLPPIRSKK